MTWREKHFTESSSNSHLTSSPPAQNTVALVAMLRPCFLYKTQHVSQVGLLCHLINQDFITKSLGSKSLSWRLTSYKRIDQRQSSMRQFGSQRWFPRVQQVTSGIPGSQSTADTLHKLCFGLQTTKLCCLGTRHGIS